jgi:hypothetical protein
MSRESTLPNSSLNLHRVGHVQAQGHDALIRMRKGLARTGIHALRASFQGFLKQGPPNAAIGSSDQNCLFLIFMSFFFRGDSADQYDYCPSRQSVQLRVEATGRWGVRPATLVPRSASRC